MSSGTSPIDPILIGKGEELQYLLPAFGNRHGLITGATGTGKTVTLQVLAEGFSGIGVPVFLAELYKGLKPGATLGIVDHHAHAGSPVESASELHRIDPAIVIADIEGAGFELTGRSDLLRNSSDDLAISVFDPSVRGKTDRFVLKFRKP